MKLEEAVRNVLTEAKQKIKVGDKFKVDMDDKMTVVVVTSLKPDTGRRGKDVQVQLPGKTGTYDSAWVYDIDELQPVN